VNSVTLTTEGEELGTNQLDIFITTNGIGSKVY
jgi:hypothetical protein